ncbi:MAG: group 1 truncated hemoglobin [Candidatus Brocadiaceae bacterium]|nr:group 1 truncated hemoglobin [Candidatus Brocadiaceae bacterium]
MPSLYERIGGEKAINVAVDLFYKKVLTDNRINHFFKDINLAKQSQRLKAFLAYAFGVPNKYTGRPLREAHARLVKKGLNDSHFDAVLENLGNSLKELGVSEDLIEEAAKIAESVRNDILNRQLHLVPL